LNCDERDEIVCGTQMSVVHSLSGVDGRTLWDYPFETSGAIQQMAAISDSTDDLVSEIVAASANGMVTCLDGAAATAKTPCVIADANCDSVVSHLDALVALQLLSEVKSFASDATMGFCFLGDANHDGRLSTDDIIVVLKVLSGVSTPQK
jgi:hypothetical protein